MMIRFGCAAFLVLASHAFAVEAQQNAVRLPSAADDFIVREVKIPMRDGVELHNYVVSPKRMDGPLPIMLARTPYDASRHISSVHRTTMAAVLPVGFAELEGYIWVFQDIRGRHKSGGSYLAFRPLRGPFNDTGTDHATDAWDTVEWLVSHVDGNNGRVGVFGTSYDGWLALISLLDPHPAVRAAVPVNPVADLWMGDDAFHNGAFRIGFMAEFLHRMEIQPNRQIPLPYDHYDLYSWWLRQGSVREFQRTYLPDAPLFAQLVNRPAYDDFWQDAALDRHLARSKSRLVPTLHVHGWFDQEDIYGAPAAYEAMEARDTQNDLNYFTAGPWYHGENWSKGSAGPIGWTEAAPRRWRRQVLAPFLAHYLKDGPSHGLANAVVFNTGSDRWENFERWPKAPDTRGRKLYLAAGRSLSWQPPAADVHGVERYVSDPARPVPYQPRPIRAYFSDDTNRSEWRTWHLRDQRFASDRPDVLTYVSDPLPEDLTLRGRVTARLFAETTGSDADWVVKLIDVYPDQDPYEPEMSGYEFMISGEILRGRYRESFSEARPIASNRVLEYTIRMPQANHTFRRGHRLMVQVQSSWFPLYDRNPQVYVPSIMDARAEDHRAATHTVHSTLKHPSYIEIDVVR